MKKQAPPIENEPTVRKTKRNRHKTACAINRRKGCGICGSLNVCLQGVKFCNVCGLEVEFLVEGPYVWYEDLPCDCLKVSKYNKNLTYRDIGIVVVGKCMDCGAVRTKVCPNNKRHDCWKKGAKYFCTHCGYRR